MSFARPICRIAYLSIAFMVYSNLANADEVNFEREVKPIFELHCVSCHRADNAEGNWDMSTKSAAFESGDHVPNIVPADPSKSAIYFLLMLPADDDQRMPPASQDVALSNEEKNTIKRWIEQGATWPSELKLVATVKSRNATNNPDSKELVARIHAKIRETAEASNGENTSSYETTIAKSGVSFAMIAIPGGEFTMGSPETESERNEDEGPPIKRKVQPFWMGKYEVTWDEYEPFQLSNEGRNKDGSRKAWLTTDHPMELVSQPTPPYQPMDFGMGRKGFPAICMTQHAANKYCQWLSAQTGHFYRLPTEAEWEYAARAGTETAYFWGDDPAKLADYAWFYDNSNTYQYSRVGAKKPNPWGLYDIYGNVREWCLDQYESDAYQRWADESKPGASRAPWVKSKTPYPHVARGGSYDDDAQDCRSASRKASDASWKQQDPQLPKSIWYLTDATWLGFRIVRPREIPSVDEMYDAWNNGVANEE